MKSRNFLCLRMACFPSCVKTQWVRCICMFPAIFQIVLHVLRPLKDHLSYVFFSWLNTEKGIKYYRNGMLYFLCVEILQTRKKCMDPAKFLLLVCGEMYKGSFEVWILFFPFCMLRKWMKLVVLGMACFTPCLKNA